MTPDSPPLEKPENSLKHRFGTGARAGLASFRKWGFHVTPDKIDMQLFTF
jgi:hypothetical protein